MLSKTDHSILQIFNSISKRLSRPIRNIYTYSFSMNPVNVEPSGNLDFSQIQSEKTNIEVKMDTSVIDRPTDNIFIAHVLHRLSNLCF